MVEIVVLLQLKFVFKGLMTNLALPGSSFHPLFVVLFHMDVEGLHITDSNNLEGKEVIS